MTPAGSRRVAVEILATGDTRPWIEVGSRTVYHYWNVLNPHYRGVLLPPQRKTDGQSIGWNWVQPSDAATPSAEEIQALRRRLSESHRRFVDAVGEGLTGAPFSAEDAEELRARMGRIVAHFVALSEREVMGYIAKTAQGLQFHSWGSPVPAPETYPDDEVLSVRGRVRQGEAPVPGAEVTLEDADGRRVDETRADSSGAYGFYKLKSGSYRLKAASQRATFPLEGIPVELADTPIADADLVADDPAEKIDVGEPLESAAVSRKSVRAESSRTRGRWWLWGLLLLFGAVAVVAWLWWRASPAETGDPRSKPIAAQPQVAWNSGAARTGNAKETAADAGNAGPASGGGWSRSDRPALKGGAARSQLEEFDSSKRNAPPQAASGPKDRSGRPAPEGGLPGDVEGQPEGEGGLPGRDASGVAAASGAASASGPSKVRTPSPSPVAGGAKSKGEDRPEKGAPVDVGEATEASSPGPVPGQAAGSAKRDRRSEAKPKAARPVGQGAGGSPAESDGPSEWSDAIFDGREGENDAGVASESAESRAASASAGKRSRNQGRSPGSAAAPGAQAVEGEAGSEDPADEAQPEDLAGLPRPMLVQPGEERWLLAQVFLLRRWEVALRREQIVPTAPVEEGQPDPAATLHDASWAGARASLPALFSSERVRSGLAFVLRDPNARAPLRWQSSSHLGVRAVARGARADISWDGGSPASLGVHTLRDALGAEWVRLRTTASGELSIERREGVDASLWARVSVDDGWEHRLRWLADGGEDLPEGWSESRTRGTVRLQAPLDLLDPTLRGDIQLMDTVTGWAFGGAWTLRPRPAAAPLDAAPR